MKTIQKFTLGLLAVVATSTSTFASNLIIEVDGSDIATNSGVITGTAQKIGTGTLVLSGSNDSTTHNVLTKLTINNGRVQYAATGNVGALVTMDTAGVAGVTPALEVLMGAATVSADGTSASIAAKSVVVPPLAMISPAQLQVDANVAATLSAFASVSPTVPAVSALSLVAQTSAAALKAAFSPAAITAGASVVAFKCTAIAASDLGTSDTGTVLAVPINVRSGINLQVASGGKLPNALVDVSGQLEIQTAAQGQCPGAVIIENAGILYVDASVAVPAAGDTAASSDLFGTLKFISGSTLKLGNGASWARNITVGTAL